MWNVPFKCLKDLQLQPQKRFSMKVVKSQSEKQPISSSLEFLMALSNLDTFLGISVEKKKKNDIS